MRKLGPLEVPPERNDERRGRPKSRISGKSEVRMPLILAWFVAGSPDRGLRRGFGPPN